MRTFTPKEKFAVKADTGNKAVDYHMERKTGTNEWVKVPGRLSLRVGYLEKHYEDIDNLLQDIEEVIPENRYILSERVGRLKHKLYGIKYHTEIFVDEEKKIINEYQTEYDAPDHDSIFHNPKLIYEMESFLFQIKSVLDIFTQIMSMIFNISKMNTYSISEKGNKIINKLLEGNYNLLRNELANQLQMHESWVRDAIDMRDEITHISDLRGFLCFIKHAWDGGEHAYVSYPSMPDGTRASSYMINTSTNLLQLLSDSIPFLITKVKLDNKQSS